MVPVLPDHLPELLEPVLHDRGRGLSLHAFESVGPPGRNLDLDQDPLPVAFVEDAPVLLPVDAGEDAVQLLEVAMIVGDPGGGLGHAVSRVAPGHPLDAGQPDRLAVKEEFRAADLDPADAEGRG